MDLYGLVVMLGYTLLSGCGFVLGVQSLRALPFKSSCPDYS